MPFLHEPYLDCWTLHEFLFFQEAFLGLLTFLSPEPPSPSSGPPFRVHHFRPWLPPLLEQKVPAGRCRWPVLVTQHRAEWVPWLQSEWLMSTGSYTEQAHVLPICSCQPSPVGCDPIVQLRKPRLDGHMVEHSGKELASHLGAIVSLEPHLSCCLSLPTAPGSVQGAWCAKSLPRP